MSILVGVLTESVWLVFLRTRTLGEAFTIPTTPISSGDRDGKGKNWITQNHGCRQLQVRDNTYAPLLLCPPIAALREVSHRL